MASEADLHARARRLDLDERPVARGAVLALIAVLVAGCGARPARPRATAAETLASEVALYRDRAIVAQRVDVDVPPAALATVRVTVAAGVSADDVLVLDRGELAVTVRAAAPPAGPPPSAEDAPAPELDARPKARPAPAKPTELELIVGAPRPGRWSLRLGYTTDRLAWDAAYLAIVSPARDRATVRGAISIRNTTGIALPGARVRCLDSDLGAATSELAQRLAGPLTGVDPRTTPGPVPYELGRRDLADGETRVDVLTDTPARPMRSVLVFDPIGPSLDHPGALPSRSASLGAHAGSSRVTESFEIARDLAASAGLPGGPVHLVERTAEGHLALLGEARLFGSGTRVATADTIAIGTADGVTGKRERRELTVDDQRRRLVEELAITVTNTRAVPVEVVLREHLYRGQNWTLAYQSVPVGPEAKEGPQQIALRTTVPARGTARVLYVVVYTW